MRVVSSDSSNPSIGRMVGSRRASIVLPVTVYTGLRHAGRGFRQSLPVSLSRIKRYDAANTPLGLAPFTSSS